MKVALNIPSTQLPQTARMGKGFMTMLDIVLGDDFAPDLVYSSCRVW